jgi:hypothetical protein
MTSGRAYSHVGVVDFRLFSVPYEAKTLSSSTRQIRKIGPDVERRLVSWQPNYGVATLLMASFHYERSRRAAQALLLKEHRKCRYVGAPIIGPDWS